MTFKKESNGYGGAPDSGTVNGEESLRKNMGCVGTLAHGEY